MTMPQPCLSLTRPAARPLKNTVREPLARGVECGMQKGGTPCGVLLSVTRYAAKPSMNISGLPFPHLAGPQGGCPVVESVVLAAAGMVTP